MEKERLIIDIRRLNTIIKKNAYFMFTQSDMMLKMIDTDVIMIVDIITFFHQ